MKRRVFPVGFRIGLALGAMLGWLNTSYVQADVRLPSVLGSGMVVQQGKPIAIWGTAEPGEKITVKLGDDSAATTADNAGNWKTHLKPLKAGGPHSVTVVGQNTITLNDILVGEVWVCSGQSNMEWSVAASKDPQSEASNANHPNIRHFTLEKDVAFEPKTDCRGRWETCSPQTVARFSAVAYYFGRHLNKELDVPIGLIHTSWGGTPAESWTTAETLAGNADFALIHSRALEQQTNYLQQELAYRRQLSAWQATKNGNRPNPPSRHPWTGAGLYNAMIAPITPLSIAGAIWYQGESNAGRAYQYRTLFPAMIKDWRRVFKQGDFPFLFVQLAPYRYGGADPKNCAELREAQTMTLSLPNTGMAVTTDIGDVKDIHPKNKQEVGRRLALWALDKTYGKTQVHSGPLFDSAKTETGSIRISFKNVGSGLMAKGEKLTHFEIAGADQKFVPAEASIDGETVIVKCASVGEPVAVRFGWRDDAEPNFFNKEGLPASPFRTDTWKGVTAESR